MDRGKPGAEYVVIAPQTPFYKFGPAQNRGPDLMLELGQRVTLVSREYGFSKFRLTDGVTGYASSNDFSLAPPLPPSPTAPGAKRPPRPRRSAPPPPDIPLDILDVPLPQGEAAPAKPGFRLNVSPVR